MKLASYLLIAVALVLVIRIIPVDAVVGGLKGWVEGLGVWGPLIFAGVYALWTVAALPGSALTLAAGAVFGLWIGAASVIVGATIGAALAFLIARHLARDRVERMTRNSPKLRAVYDAIGEGGWKIVAMLRLSPALPFNVQNYFYGVTAIGFWPCVLATMVFIIPGTFMFVYFGYVAGAAASGGETTTAEWILRGVGLAATIGVTVYVTKLANKKLEERTELDQVKEDGEEPAQAKGSSPRSAIVTAAVALLLLAGALYANSNSQKIRGLFGPPPVSSQEAYAENPGGPTFDHSALGRLLKQFVDERGMVDYRGLETRESDIDAYLAALADAPFDSLGRDEKLALLINAYNAFTLKLILDHYPVDSIRDVPSDERWDAERWTLAGDRYSLNEIEHEKIRPKFVEPRIHFALVCAAVGCPKLRNEAYEGARIDAQLEDQTRDAHSHDRWFQFDREKNVARLTALYDWYKDDFLSQADSVLDYAARYSLPLRKALDSGAEVRIEWLDYDWSLNEQ